MTARCTASRCEVVDLSADEMTECATDADCVLRPQACCPCGAFAEYLAVNVAQVASYEALQCASVQGCDDCVHDYPAGLRATCGPEHCVLSR